jgi:hypothetical protein
MINGDISNETPPRIIVTIDVVVQSDVNTTKGVFGKPKTSRTVTGLNNAQLSKLWNAAFNYGLAIELAAFSADGWVQADVDKLMTRLDNRGGNPFNYAELYDSFQDLVSELPYRPNLKAVIDLSNQVAKYGSWGLDLNNL